MEFRYGLMDPDMRDNGERIKPTDKESCIMLMEMFMKANGLTIKQRESAVILMQTELTMKENGTMTNSMVMVSNLGQMVLVTTVFTKRERKRVEVDLLLPMEVITKVNFM